MCVKRVNRRVWCVFYEHDGDTRRGYRCPGQSLLGGDKQVFRDLMKTHPTIITVEKGYDADSVSLVLIRPVGASSGLVRALRKLAERANWHNAQ